MSKRSDLRVFVPPCGSSVQILLKKAMIVIFLPIKSDCYLQPPQFVDILLADEDSSDEEYRPDEEDEDETAEDVRLLSN